MKDCARRSDRGAAKAIIPAKSRTILTNRHRENEGAKMLLIGAAFSSIAQRVYLEKKNPQDWNQAGPLLGRLSSQHHDRVTWGRQGWMRVQPGDRLRNCRDFLP